MLTCRHCLRTFKTRAGLNRHLAIKHTTTSISLRGPGR